MKRFSIIVGIMTLVLFVSVLVGVSDVVSVQGHRGGHHGKGFWANLTEEQREAVREKKEEMRSQGATREEIHSAVAEMLEGYGIEVPEDWHGPKGFGHRKAGFKANLTDEQREVVREKIKEMRGQGATCEEIHSAAAEILEGYGIELPENWGRRHGLKGLGHGPCDLGANLTNEQRQTLREKTKEMRSQGATCEEIHSAVDEMLEGYGIELPENWGEGHRGGHMRGFGLTDEQREIMRNLSNEQRRTLRETIREMRNQGATREEIRAKVAEMLQGYGFELPEDSESMSSETASSELHIQTQSYPNPFNPQTEIAYSLPEDSYVKLTLYNIQGQKVTTLVDEYQSVGTRKVVWDGRDESGESVASGVYLYRIEAGPHEVTNRMVLLK